MRVYKSLVGRLTILSMAMLTVGMTALLLIANRQISDRVVSDFERDVLVLSDFLSQQINTGTRLKRGAMIEPAIQSAIAADGIPIAALRVMHSEGVEVISSLAEGQSAALLNLLPTPTFDGEAITQTIGESLVTATPIILGAGADAVHVGDLLIVWDKSEVLLEQAALFRVLLECVLAIGVVFAALLVFLLHRMIAAPLKRAVNAMNAVVADQPVEKWPPRSSTEMAQITDSLKVFDAHATERRELLLELTGTMQAAQQGDFSRRLNAAKGAEGSVQALVNDLLDTVSAGLNEALRVIDALATQDLTARMQGNFSGAFDRLKQDTNNATNVLDETMSLLGGSANKIMLQASDLNSSVSQLSVRTQQNAATLEQTSAAIENISTSLRESAGTAAEVTGSTDQALAQAKTGEEVVRKAIDVMHQIDDYSNRISQIISLIDDVAFQTNLLALNAGVEAARAGESGKGFAVVASEVRSLAQRAAESASEIKSLITESTEHVQNGVAQVGQAGDVISSIVDSVSKVADGIKDISRIAGDQSSSVEEITIAVRDLDRVTQENADMAEQTSQIAGTLSSSAETMQSSMKVFRFSTDDAQAQPLLRSA